MKFQAQFSYGRIKSMKTQGSVAPKGATLRICSMFLINMLFLSHAYGHPIVEGWQDHLNPEPGFSIGPRVTLFSTSQNYNFNSQSVPLANAVSDQRYYLDLNLSYGFDENLFVYGRISAIYTRITGATFTDQSTFGLSDQLLGAAYRIFQSGSGFSLGLQAEATIPAYKNANSVINGTPYMGDGSTDFTFGSFLEVPLSIEGTHQLYLIGGAGFTWRSFGFSSCVPWNVLLRRTPDENGGLTFDLGMRGTFSLNTDLTSPSIAITDQNRGAGGSFLIDGINPSWTLVQASIGYQSSSKINYYVSGAMPIAGTNAPNGIQVALGVQFNLSGDKDTSTRKKVPDTVHEGTFKNYDLEAKVLSTNDQLYLVKIDKGSNSGIEKGQIFDIFQDKHSIARAKVTNVNNDESALRVLEYFQEQSIEVDAVVKRIVP